MHSFLNLTGADVIIGGTQFKSEDRKPLFMTPVKTNPRLTKSHVKVFDVSFEVPDEIFDLIAESGGCARFVVPSLTLFLMKDSIGGFCCVNTNPGHVTRDANGFIIPGSSDSLLVTVPESQKSLTRSVNSGESPKSPESPEIHNIHVLLPHPVNIVAEDGSPVITLCMSGDPGRSEFKEYFTKDLLTSQGPVKVVHGANLVPQLSVPQTETHDGVLVSANLYGILNNNRVIGNYTEMKKVFGRDNFSLLILDNDTMVRDKSTSRIIGAQNLLCVDRVGKL